MHILGHSYFRIVLASQHCRHSFPVMHSGLDIHISRLLNPFSPFFSLQHIPFFTHLHSSTLTDIFSQLATYFLDPRHSFGLNAADKPASNVCHRPHVPVLQPLNLAFCPSRFVGILPLNCFRLLPISPSLPGISPILTTRQSFRFPIFSPFVTFILASIIPILHFGSA